MLELSVYTRQPLLRRNGGGGGDEKSRIHRRSADCSNFRCYPLDPGPACRSSYHQYDKNNKFPLSRSAP